MKAAIIGAGFGGLALGIRLQSAGVETVIVEARDRPGGRAYVWERDGHVFDAGPTVITDPDCLRELWALSGGTMAADIELMPVTPFYRLSWPDGAQFDYSNDDSALFREITRFNPADVAGYRGFRDFAEGAFEAGYRRYGAVAFESFGSMLRAAPSLARFQSWRSVYSIVSSYVTDPHLRQALSFHTLLIGGNPMRTSALYALIHALERRGGVWFAKGGTHRLVMAMAALFERLGGTLRLGDPVTEIETLGDVITGVRTRSGWRAQADAVASNADIVHSYRDLLPQNRRAQRMAAKLVQKRYSPSLFLVHFGLKGRFPEIPHHSVLFGPRYGALLEDIFDRGVLSSDFSLYLHHPTASDPSLSPDGHATFYALAPVPHLGKLPIDWADAGPKLQERILDEIGRRLIPDIRDRLTIAFHYGPADFAHDLSAHLGSAFSLEPTLIQSAWFRVHNRDDVIRNLYFVGAGTHPGAGIPGVIGSAKATAELMLERWDG